MDDAELVIIEHHVTVQRTARYYTLGDASVPVGDVWIVCHGFAQLARAFVEEFRAIARPGRLIVAPEALNRFYLDREGGRAGPSARVGATWMTREDRLAEIDDYVRYLDDLVHQVVGRRKNDVRVTALGFSQAAATVGRWLVHGGSTLDRVILAAFDYHWWVGAIAALAIMGTPFGFMAFLGMISLVGVIVSHVIVLFDFIEEKHAEGEPLEQALLDAGIIRLRPVLITVGATVIALIPLAMHGGPLWEPMCYAQIGGLSAATFITLLLVPVFYAIFVKDLKLVKWEKEKA